MPSDIEKIEEFFETKFELSDSSSNDGRGLSYFDGYAHWHIWLEEQKQLIHFTADKNLRPNTFPLLEIGMFYSGVCIAPLTNIGITLHLRPKGVPYNNNLLTITKTTAGRLSFCTTIGEILGFQLDEHWENLIKSND